MRNSLLLQTATALHRLIVISLSLWWSSTVSYGELVFKSRNIETAMSPFDAEVVTEFAFKNEGNTSVKITALKSACACTIPEVKKLSYAPGESGVIVVKFEAGPRHGVQRQGVVVKTDHPDQQNIALSLTATIPKVMTLSGQLLLWKEGEPLEPKTLAVTASEGMRVRDLRAVIGSSRLRVAVQRQGDAKFAVVVTPSPHARNISEVLEVEAILEGGQVKRSSLYVRVR